MLSSFAASPAMNPKDKERNGKKNLLLANISIRKKKGEQLSFANGSIRTNSYSAKS